MTWENLHRWWLRELAGDPAYVEEIEPLLVELLRPSRGRLYIDLGCGEGRTMKTLRSLGASAVGCDLNPALLKMAKERGNVVLARLPNLAWLKRNSLDGAIVGLVLEHLSDERGFFQEVARVVRRGGPLAMVINHPIWTAPQSSPIEDVGGETLWRPGAYFGRGFSDEPAGRSKVRFYHRSMAELLNAAADAGWGLRRVIELGITPEQVARVPSYAGQEHIPRVLGARWTKT
jgi:SAM-dependent methyltransferase